MALIMIRHVDILGFRIPGKLATPLDMYEEAVVAVLAKTTHHIKSKKTSSRKTKETELEIISGIADIRDELAMIENVLLQQQDILDKFYKDLLEDTKPQDDSEEVDRNKVRAGRHRLDQFIARVRKIGGDSERIQQTMDSMLDMRRAHAAVEDTQSSIIIGIAALGFAIVTIIFTPLAFLTSLYALPIKGLLDRQHSSKAETQATANTTFHDTTSVTENGYANTTYNEDDTPFYTDGYIAWTFIVTEAATLLITTGAVWAILWFFDLDGIIWEHLREVCPRTKKLGQWAKGLFRRKKSAEVDSGDAAPANAGTSNHAPSSQASPKDSSPTKPDPKQSSSDPTPADPKKKAGPGSATTATITPKPAPGHGAAGTSSSTTATSADRSNVSGDSTAAVKKQDGTGSHASNPQPTAQPPESQSQTQHTSGQAATSTQNDAAQVNQNTEAEPGDLEAAQKTAREKQSGWFRRRWRK